MNTERALLFLALAAAGFAAWKAWQATQGAREQMSDRNSGRVVSDPAGFRDMDGGSPVWALGDLDDDPSDEPYVF